METNSPTRPDSEEQTQIESSPEISLRPLTLTDVDDFMVWATDEKVTRFCTWEPYKTRESAVEYIQSTVIPHPWFRAITLNGRPIGAVSVSINSGESRGELGYVLGSEFWGKGIVTEAVKLVSKTIFIELSFLQRVEALVDVENVGSQRVMEKVGFVREGVLRKFMVLKGKLRDMVMFSLLPTDPIN